MTDWLLYSLLSLGCFGLWGIFGKLSSFYIKAQDAIIYEACGIALVALCLLIKYQFKIDTNLAGIVYSALMGISGIIGTLLLLLALKNGNTAVVTFITALYPSLVLIFSFLVFKEPISVQHAFGILFAILSILLFTLN
ncbi:MAG: EamA family transporter [Methylococcaceae bacterium]